MARAIRVAFPPANIDPSKNREKSHRKLGVTHFDNSEVVGRVAELIAQERRCVFQDLAFREPALELSVSDASSRNDVS